ncbi:hypothetical protein AB2B38_008935 [Balneola sp. MJW-20]
MLLVAGLQWIIGPIIEYANPSMNLRYFMYVDKTTYMSFVVPGYMLFAFTILLRIKKSKKYYRNLDDLQYYSKIGLFLVIIGFVSDIALGFLGFFGYIIANFKYVGAIILFFSQNKKLRVLFYLVIILLLYRSIYSGMFHDLILWSVLYYMFWAYRYKPSIKTKLVSYSIALLLLISLQSIKAAYRAEVWRGNSSNNIELFTSLMYNNIVGQEDLVNGEYGSENNNVRLNQGWIISAIMTHIPSNVNYLGGSTVITAFESALLPRVLAPDKVKAGGRKNFKRFTGLEIGESTSMGISIIGEAYGNFGVYGGILFMGIWAWLILFVWRLLIKKSTNQILIYAFLPLVFLQVIKAETELAVVLNHLVKTGVVVLVLLIIYKIFISVYKKETRIAF